jgi:integrase-like protein
VGCFSVKLKHGQFTGGTLPHAGSTGEVCESGSPSALNVPNFTIPQVQDRGSVVAELPGCGKLADYGIPTTGNCATLLAVTPSAVSTGVPVPRRRFQRGSLVGRSGRWYGVYRADVPQADGTLKREQCWQPFGLVCEQSERAAWKEFQPYLDRVNEAAIKMPPKIGLALAEFVEEWRTNVAVNLKDSTACAAESHLRAHILPKLGSLTLTEINTKMVQGFVAYLASGGRSRKTVENVLLTLSSLLRTASDWGYACGNFKFSALTLPREGVKKDARCFTDEEMRRMIAAAPEPLRTILIIMAVLGLRIGEALALRICDVDFATHIIRVRQSVDAASRKVGGVKSKASSADLPMSAELEAQFH